MSWTVHMQITYSCMSLVNVRFKIVMTKCILIVLIVFAVLETGFLAPRRFPRELESEEAKALTGFVAPRRFNRESGSNEEKGKKLKNAKNAGKVKERIQSQTLEAALDSLVPPSSTAGNLPTMKTTVRPLQQPIVSKSNYDITADTTTTRRVSGEPVRSTLSALSNQTTRSPLKDQSTLSATSISLTTFLVMGVTTRPSTVHASSKETWPVQLTSTQRPTAIQLTTRGTVTLAQSLENATTDTSFLEKPTLHSDILPTTLQPSTTEKQFTKEQNQVTEFAKDLSLFSTLSTGNVQDSLNTTNSSTTERFLSSASTRSSLDYQISNVEQPKGESERIGSSSAFPPTYPLTESLNANVTQLEPGTHSPQAANESSGSSLNTSSVSFPNLSTTPLPMSSSNESLSILHYGLLTRHETGYVTEVSTSQPMLALVDQGILTSKSSFGEEIESNGYHARPKDSLTRVFSENSTLLKELSMNDPVTNNGTIPDNDDSFGFSLAGGTQTSTALTNNNVTTEKEPLDSGQSVLTDRVVEDVLVNNNISTTEKTNEPSVAATVYNTTAAPDNETVWAKEKSVEFLRTDGTQTSTSSANSDVLTEKGSLDSVQSVIIDRPSEGLPLYDNPSTAEKNSNPTVPATMHNNTAVSNKETVLPKENSVEFQRTNGSQTSTSSMNSVALSDTGSLDSGPSVLTDRTTEGLLTIGIPSTSEKPSEHSVSAIIYNTIENSGDSRVPVRAHELQTSSTLPERGVPLEKHYPEPELSDKPHPITQVAATRTTSPEQSASTASESSTMSTVDQSDVSLHTGEIEKKPTSLERTALPETLYSTTPLPGLGTDINLEHTIERATTVSRIDNSESQPSSSTYSTVDGSILETVVKDGSIGLQTVAAARTTVDFIMDSTEKHSVLSTSPGLSNMQGLSTIHSNGKVTLISPLANSSDIYMTESQTVASVSSHRPFSEENSETTTSTIRPNSQPHTPTASEGLNEAVLDTTPNSRLPWSEVNSETTSSSVGPLTQPIVPIITEGLSEVAADTTEKTLVDSTVSEWRKSKEILNNSAEARDVAMDTTPSLLMDTTVSRVENVNKLLTDSTGTTYISTENKVESSSAGHLVTQQPFTTSPWSEDQIERKPSVLDLVSVTAMPTFSHRVDTSTSELQTFATVKFQASNSEGEIETTVSGFQPTTTPNVPVDQRSFNEEARNTTLRLELESTLSLGPDLITTIPTVTNRTVLSTSELESSATLKFPASSSKGKSETIVPSLEPSTPPGIPVNNKGVYQVAVDTTLRPEIDSTFSLGSDLITAIPTFTNRTYANTSELESSANLNFSPSNPEGQRETIVPSHGPTTASNVPVGTESFYQVAVNTTLLPEPEFTISLGSDLMTAKPIFTNHTVTNTSGLQSAANSKYPAPNSEGERETIVSSLEPTTPSSVPVGTESIYQVAGDTTSRPELQHTVSLGSDFITAIPTFTHRTYASTLELVSSSNLKFSASNSGGERETIVPSHGPSAPPSIPVDTESFYQVTGDTTLYPDLEVTDSLGTGLVTSTTIHSTGTNPSKFDSSVTLKFPTSNSEGESETVVPNLRHTIPPNVKTDTGNFYEIVRDTTQRPDVKFNASLESDVVTPTPTVTNRTDTDTSEFVSSVTLHFSASVPKGQSETVIPSVTTVTPANIPVDTGSFHEGIRDTTLQPELEFTVSFGINPTSTLAGKDSKAVGKTTDETIVHTGDDAVSTSLIITGKPIPSNTETSSQFKTDGESTVTGSLFFTEAFVLESNVVSSTSVPELKGDMTSTEERHLTTDPAFQPTISPDILNFTGSFGDPSVGTASGSSLVPTEKSQSNASANKPGYTDASNNSTHAYGLATRNEGSFDVVTTVPSGEPARQGSEKFTVSSDLLLRTTDATTEAPSSNNATGTESESGTTLVSPVLGSENRNDHDPSFHSTATTEIRDFTVDFGSGLLDATISPSINFPDTADSTRLSSQTEKGNDKAIDTTVIPSVTFKSDGEKLDFASSVAPESLHVKSSPTFETEDVTLNVTNGVTVLPTFATSHIASKVEFEPVESVTVPASIPELESVTKSPRPEPTTQSEISSMTEGFDGIVSETTLDALAFVHSDGANHYDQTENTYALESSTYVPRFSVSTVGEGVDPIGTRAADQSSTQRSELSTDVKILSNESGLVAETSTMTSLVDLSMTGINSVETSPAHSTLQYVEEIATTPSQQQTTPADIPSSTESSDNIVVRTTPDSSVIVTSDRDSITVVLKPKRLEETSINPINVNRVRTTSHNNEYYSVTTRGVEPIADELPTTELVPTIEVVPTVEGVSTTDIVRTTPGRPNLVTDNNSMSSDSDFITKTHAELRDHTTLETDYFRSTPPMVLESDDSGGTTLSNRDLEPAPDTSSVAETSGRTDLETTPNPPATFVDCSRPSTIDPEPTVEYETFDGAENTLKEPLDLDTHKPQLVKPVSLEQLTTQDWVAHQTSDAGLPAESESATFVGFQEGDVSSAPDVLFTMPPNYTATVTDTAVESTLDKPVIIVNAGSSVTDTVVNNRTDTLENSTNGTERLFVNDEKEDRLVTLSPETPTVQSFSGLDKNGSVLHDNASLDNLVNDSNLPLASEEALDSTVTSTPETPTTQSFSEFGHDDNLPLDDTDIITKTPVPTNIPDIGNPVEAKPVVITDSEDVYPAVTPDYQLSAQLSVNDSLTSTPRLSSTAELGDTILAAEPEGDSSLTETAVGYTEETSPTTEENWSSTPEQTTIQVSEFTTDETAPLNTLNVVARPILENCSTPNTTTIDSTTFAIPHFSAASELDVTSTLENQSVTPPENLSSSTEISAENEPHPERPVTTVNHDLLKEVPQPWQNSTVSGNEAIKLPNSEEGAISVTTVEPEQVKSILDHPSGSRLSGDEHDGSAQSSDAIVRNDQQEDTDHDIEPSQDGGLSAESSEDTASAISTEEENDQSSNNSVAEGSSEWTSEGSEEESEEDVENEAMASDESGVEDEDHMADESDEVDDAVHVNGEEEEASDEEEEEETSEEEEEEEKVAPLSTLEPSYPLSAVPPSSEERIESPPVGSLQVTISAETGRESDTEDEDSQSQEAAAPAPSDQASSLETLRVPTRPGYSYESDIHMVSSEPPLNGYHSPAAGDTSESGKGFMRTSESYFTTTSSSGKILEMSSEENSEETYSYEPRFPVQAESIGFEASSNVKFSQSPSLTQTPLREHFSATTGSELLSYSTRPQDYVVQHYSSEEHRVNQTPWESFRLLANAPRAPSLKEAPVRTCVNCVQKPDASQESLSTVKDLLQSELASLIFASLTPSLPHAASPATFEALNPSVGPTALPSTTFISSLVPTSPSVLPTAIPSLEKEPGEFASRSATAAIASFEDESRPHASWPETTTLVSDTPSFQREEIYRPTRTPVLTSSTTLATHELRMKTKSYTVEPSSISFTNPSTPVWFPREQGALPRNLATLTKQEKEKDMLHFFSRWRSNLKILSPQPARLTFSNTNSLYLKSVRTSVSTNTLPSSSTVSQVIPDRHDAQLTDSPVEPKQLLENQEEVRMSLESQQEDASSSVIIGSNSTSFSESNISSYASYSTEPQTRIFPTTDNQISRSAYNLTSNLSSISEIGSKFLPKTPIGKLQAKFLVRRRTMVSLSVLRANSSSASKLAPMTRTVLRKTSTIHSALSKYNASVAAGPNKKPLITRSALQSRQNLVYNAEVPLRLVTTAPYRAVLNASGKSAFFARMLHRNS